jgi:hypothetical protein
MTALEHNKYVGLAHIAYGVIHILMIGVMGLFMLGMMGMIARDAPSGDAPPAAFFAIIMAFAVGVNVILSIPSFIAGYAFLKRKPWAKVAGIIAAVLSAMSFPFGTAVCVYTFWFLFSESGKLLYDGVAKTLPPPPPGDWDTVKTQNRQPQFSTSPPTAPDWRS